MSTKKHREEVVQESKTDLVKEVNLLITKDQPNNG